MNTKTSPLKTSVEYEKSLKQELINILTENHSEILFAADSYKTSIEIYSSLFKYTQIYLDTWKQYRGSGFFNYVSYEKV